MKILNLTQHAATPEQLEAGVIDPSPELKEKIINELTFDQIPNQAEIENRARRLANHVLRENYYHAMIGGAPYLMWELEVALKNRFITPYYAFSVRESVEERQKDGSVKKASIFKHAGLIKKGIGFID